MECIALVVALIYVTDFNGFERMAEPGESAIEVSIPVALNSDVGLECDVLDANPPPQIKWCDDQGEVTLDNSVRYLDNRRYLYLRRLQPSHLERQYYCNITNANSTWEISAPTRYVLTDNLTQGVLMDYKQIGHLTAFVGNTSFEFAYVGGVFGSNNLNGTTNQLFMNGTELARTGNVGQINTMSCAGTLCTLLSSPGKVQLKVIVNYNSVSSPVMRNGSMTVHQIPRIINTTQDTREHLVCKSLTLACQFEGSPLPNVTFYFNGVILPDNGVTIINTTLIIPYPQVSDSGIYQCIVANEFGDDQIAWLVKIRNPISPTVKPLNLTRLGALEDQDVGILIIKSINSTVNFFVDVVADPCPNVVWSLNGTALGPINNTFSYNNPCVGGSSFIWTFTLNVILTSETSGQYMANFTNCNGTTSLPRTYITIPSPPSIISLNISEPCLKHGSNVSLRCYTNGFPRPNIEFLQDNVRIIPGEGEFKNFVQEYFDELVITDITMKDEGRYSCNASELATQQFDYCTVPRIIGLSSTPNPQIGKLFIIQCLFNGVPVPDIIWRKGQDVIKDSDDRYLITSARNSSYLEANVASSDFNGLYECIITNIAGRDNQSIEIKLNDTISPSVGPMAGVSIGVTVGVLCILIIFLVALTVICYRVKKKDTQSVIAATAKVSSGNTHKHEASSDSTENSDEYRTLVDLTSELRLAVRSELISLTGFLLASRLISLDNDIELRNTAHSEVERSAKLVEFVQNKVRQNPRHYHSFTGILQGNQDQHKDILQRLERVYCGHKQGRDVLAVNVIVTLGIQNQIAIFEHQFRYLNRKIQAELKENQISVSDLLVSLTLLPAEIKLEYEKAISDMFPNLRRGPTITDFFYHLNPSINFLSYHLLQYIIDNFGSNPLKQEMNSYDADVITFMKTTTVKQLMDVCLGQQEIPPSFSMLEVKFDRDPETYTLYQLDQFQKRICCEIKLASITFVLNGLRRTNSFIAEWLISTVLVPHIIKSTKMLDLEFFLQRHVIDLTVNGTSILPDARPKLPAFEDLENQDVESAAVLQLSSFLEVPLLPKQKLEVQRIWNELGDCTLFPGIGVISEELIAPWDIIKGPLSKAEYKIITYVDSYVYPKAFFTSIAQSMAYPKPPTAPELSDSPPSFIISVFISVVCFSDGVLHTSHGTVDIIDDIIKPFLPESAPHLVHIPKLFFITAGGCLSTPLPRFPDDTDMNYCAAYHVASDQGYIDQWTQYIANQIFLPGVSVQKAIENYKSLMDERGEQLHYSFCLKDELILVKSCV